MIRKDPWSVAKDRRWLAFRVETVRLGNELPYSQVYWRGARCLGAQRCQYSATSSGEQHSYFDTASHFARVTVRVYLFKSSEHE